MARTYDEILAELQQYAKQNWPNWNINAKHIGNIILECLADQIEKLEYRFDYLLNELFPDTATDYKSVLRWAKLVGYPISSAQPATATVTFSLSSPASANIAIPLGTRVATSGSNPIVFETTVAAQIPAGTTSVDVPVKQTESKTETFVSAGTANQAFKTSYAPVWLDSLVVEVDNVEWSRVNDFLSSDKDSQHYIVELKEDGSVLIAFGDGVNGKIPPINSIIQVSYKITQGQEGNVSANSITQLLDVLYDANGFMVDVKVNNAAAATGGQDQEDINHIRESLPSWISTSKRCVTKNDFAEAAQNVVGVQRVLVLTNEDDSNIPVLTVKIYVVPVGGGTPTQTLLDAVIQEVTVNRPKILTLAVDVQPAKYQTINVTCNVTVASGYSATDVKTAVENAIKQFFDYSRQESDGSWAIDFGKPIYLAKLISWVMNVAGVANVSFSSPTSDITPSKDVIPALGTLTINVV